MAPDTTIRFMSEPDWETLLQSVHEGWCTPILGPEVSVGVLRARAEIARRFAVRQEAYPLDCDDDLVQVAQYLSVVMKNQMQWRDPIAEQLKRALQNQGPTAPDNPHAILAQLPIEVYATTNLDTNMVKALNGARKRVRDEICPWTDALARLARKTPLRNSEFELSPAEPVVFYLFGNVDTPLSMVLSEDDHLDFLARIAGSPAEPQVQTSDGEDRSVLPNKFLAKLNTDYLLFLGYRVNDFDFRILLRSLKSILQSNQSSNNPLIAVQLEEPSATSDSEKRRRIERLRGYLKSLCARHKLELIFGTCADFISELGRRYETYEQSHQLATAGVNP